MTKLLIALVLITTIGLILNSMWRRDDSEYKSSRSESVVTDDEPKSSSGDREIQIQVDKIRNEIRSIPIEEYGGESATPCRDINSPGGEGYYAVGAGLIGHHDLAIAVYNARNYCLFNHEGLNEKFCLVGVNMAIRNLQNLKNCYKIVFSKDVPIHNVQF